MSFDAGELTGFGSVATGDEGPGGGVGPPGPAGPAGPTGPAGSSSIRTIANAAALAALASAAIPDGTLAYVQTYKAYFALVASTQAASANVRIAASGNAGHLWVRIVESTAWWSQLSWFVDPQNTSGTASDENTGASSALPLATNAEQARRFRGRNLPGSETNSWSTTLMSDAADTDYFQVHIGSNYRNAVINCSVVGTVTASAIGTIASAVAKTTTPAPGTANSITVTGFDFSGLIGRIIRLVGTPTTTAIVEAAPSLGIAQLSEQNVNSALGAGFTAGQVVELCTLPKLPGCTVEGPGAQVNISDCRAAPAAQSNWTVEGNASAINFFRCELRGTAGIIRAPNINLIGTSVVGVTWEIRGVSSGTASSFINCPNIIVGQSATGVDSRGVWKGMGLVNAYLGIRPFCYVINSGDLHVFNTRANVCAISIDPGGLFQTNAAYYGSGNAASSAGIGLPIGATYYYSAAGGATPVNDCGQAVYHGGGTGTVPAPTTAGTSLAYGTPLSITARLNAVVAV